MVCVYVTSSGVVCRLGLPVLTDAELKALMAAVQQEGGVAGLTEPQARGVDTLRDATCRLRRQVELGGATVGDFRQVLYTKEGVRGVRCASAW